MLQTTGISRQQAIDAARTIIGYYNTYALDTVARILRREDLDAFLEDQGLNLVYDILDLRMDSDLDELVRHIDDYDKLNELRDCAERILILLGKTEYLGRDNEEQETAQEKF